MPQNHRLNLKNPILSGIYQAGVIAIARIDDLSNAIELTASLIEGGIRAIEFTLTNPEAAETIARVQEALPAVREGRAFIGAGSVLNRDQTKMVLDHGAQFVVSPHTNPEVVALCVEADIPVMPGAYTPTEIQTAWELGASAVKVFPARNLGPAYIKDILAPLPHLQLVPTGGVDLGNMESFFRSGVFAVGIGSNLMSPDMIRNRDWPALQDLARQYAQVVRAFRE